MSFEIYLICYGVTVMGVHPIRKYGNKKYATREEALAEVKKLCMTTDVALRDVRIILNATGDLEKEFSIKK